MGYARISLSIFKSGVVQRFGNSPVWLCFVTAVERVAC